jgi:hypothetical protein
MTFSACDRALLLLLLLLVVVSVLLLFAGLAAGFDKDAEAIDGLLGMGFAFMEVGECRSKPGLSFQTTSDAASCSRWEKYTRTKGWLPYLHTL